MKLGWWLWEAGCREGVCFWKCEFESNSKFYFFDVWRGFGYKYRSFGGFGFYSIFCDLVFCGVFVLGGGMDVFIFFMMFREGVFVIRKSFFGFIIMWLSFGDIIFGLGFLYFF